MFRSVRKRSFFYMYYNHNIIIIKFIVSQYKSCTELNLFVPFRTVQFCLGYFLRSSFLTKAYIMCLCIMFPWLILYVYIYIFLELPQYRINYWCPLLSASYPTNKWNRPIPILIQAIKHKKMSHNVSNRSTRVIYS